MEADKDNEGGLADGASISLRGGNSRVLGAILSITILALFARFVFLGERVAHWDEARVVYWILQYMETGEFSYKPIIHGPFVQQTTRLTLALFGRTDFAMRAVVALVGGLSPVAAWLFRERLRDAEVVALALFLAANPVLLYYSRFLRSDIPVAVFMLVGLGFFVRLLDTHKARYLYAGVAAVALGIASKENALLYLVTWVGALVLLADHRLFLNRGLPERWRTTLNTVIEVPHIAYQSVRGRSLPNGGQAMVDAHVKQAVQAAKWWGKSGPVAIIVFLVLIVAFYAPRAGAAGGVGLDTALTTGNISMLTDVIEQSTLGTWEEMVSAWTNPSKRDHPYLPYLEHFVKVLFAGASALVALSVFGFLADRYTGTQPRDLIAFGFYTGAVSVLGYPIATDIKAPWLTVHVIVPLSIPAAAGVGLLYRKSRSALANGNRTKTAAIALILMLVAGQVGYVAVESVYLNEQADSNELVQYAQPGGNLHPAIESMETIANHNRGPDVLLFGNWLVDGESANETQFAPACAQWFNALPLPWYLVRSDINVVCAADESQLARFDGKYPPVVIARTNGPQPNSADSHNISAYLSGYQSKSYLIRSHSEKVTFFINRSVLTQTETRIRMNSSRDTNSYERWQDKYETAGPLSANVGVMR